MLTLLPDFLKSQGLEKKPLLLGLSGGPDSIALFHLLLASKHPFQVAHLDHGWRPKSAQEAAQLAQICHKQQVRFHLRREELRGPNLEDLSRKARHAFFEEICAQERLEGVLLGHHADDQAETVLKRVFEGASLPKLRGLASKSVMGGITLYRPLLKVRKKTILNWLEEQEISYFQDPTNQDNRYLRSRMRTTLLPTLSQQFGKQIETSLCRLGEAAEELASFLDQSMEPFRKQIIENESSITLDFSQIPFQSPFLLKAILRDFFEKERLTLSHSVLETLLLHLQKKSAHKTIKVGRTWVEIDRQILMVKRLKNNC